MKLMLPWRPAAFHGAGRKAPFFEGWYYNFATNSGEIRYAFIAGLFLGRQSHAFIQVLDGAANVATYHRFPVTAFVAQPDRFDVRIGDNSVTITSSAWDTTSPAHSTLMAMR